MLKLAVWFALWNRRCSRVNATCYIFPLIYHISIKVISAQGHTWINFSLSGSWPSLCIWVQSDCHCHSCWDTPWGFWYLFFLSFSFFFFVISSSCFQFSMKPNTPILFIYIFLQNIISRMSCDDRHPTILL